jgi:uncharacterized protein (DUF305 family)
MENKSNILIVSLLTLIVGLILGYFAGSSRMMDGMMSGEMMNGMHETMMENEMNSMMNHGGDMNSMMDDMTSSLKDKTGEDFEIAFLEGMIEHHEGAVDMAELVLENTDRPELVQMANDIINVQTAEIEMMQEWRNTWYNN